MLRVAGPTALICYINCIQCISVKPDAVMIKVIYSNLHNHLIGESNEHLSCLFYTLHQYLMIDSGLADGNQNVIRVPNILLPMQHKNFLIVVSVLPLCTASSKHALKLASLFTCV